MGQCMDSIDYVAELSLHKKFSQFFTLLKLRRAQHQVDVIWKLDYYYF
jgi:hypothetical protein